MATKRIAVIKEGYVINVILGDPAKSPVADGTTHVVDDHENVGPGDFYAEDEHVFYRPLSTPPDYPAELLDNG